MTTKILTITLIGFLLASLLWLAFFWTPDAVTLQGKASTPAANATISLTKTLPQGGDFTLQGPDGPVALSSYRGKVVLVYFGYTFCPDICPTSLSILAQAFSGLTPKELEKTQGIFVSVDPERDTMEILKAYPPFFHPNIIGSTGTPDQVAEVARHYGASYMKQKPDSSGMYSVDHSSFTYVITPDGKLSGALPHGAPAQQVIEKIRSLIRP